MLQTAKGRVGGGLRWLHLGGRTANQPATACHSWRRAISRNPFFADMGRIYPTPTKVGTSVQDDLRRCSFFVGLALEEGAVPTFWLLWSRRDFQRPAGCRAMAGQVMPKVLRAQRVSLGCC